MKLLRSTAIVALVALPAAAHAEPVTVGTVATAATKAWATERIAENAKAADREKTVVDKAIRTGTGVSVTDMKAHGWKGGKNSFVRKPLGKLGK